MTGLGKFGSSRREEERLFSSRETQRKSKGESMVHSRVVVNVFEWRVKKRERV
jgi:hypothetical protein